MERKSFARFTAAQVAEAVKLYAEGQTIRQIAEWMDRPIASVHNVLRRRSVAMRPRGTPKAAL